MTKKNKKEDTADPHVHGTRDGAVDSDSAVEGGESGGPYPGAPPSLPDQAADVLALQAEIARLNEQIIELKYENGGLQDVARMNTAAAILPHLAPLSIQAAVEKAVEMSDALISHYQELIESNAREYVKRLTRADQESSEQEH